MRLGGGLFIWRELHPTQLGGGIVRPRQESGCGKKGPSQGLEISWRTVLRLVRSAAHSDIIARASSGKLLGRLMIGPIFTRELVVAPRRPQHFIVRTVYVTAIFVLMCTAWLVLAGTQIVRNVGDMARLQGDYARRGCTKRVCRCFAP